MADENTIRNVSITDPRGDGIRIDTNEHAPVDPRTLPYQLQLGPAAIEGSITIFSASPIYICGNEGFSH